MAIGKTMLDDWSSKQTDQRRAQYRDVDAALHAQALRRGIEFLTIIRLRRISKPSTRTVQEKFRRCGGVRADRRRGLCVRLRVRHDVQRIGRGRLPQHRRRGRRRFVDRSASTVVDATDAHTTHSDIDDASALLPCFNSILCFSTWGKSGIEPDKGTGNQLSRNV